MSSLSFLKNAKGTDVTALDITNVFTDAFDVYQLDVINYVNTDLSGYFWGRYLDSGGTVIDQTEYALGYENMRSYSSWASNVSTADSAFQLGYGQSDKVGSTGSTTMFFNPANSSTYTFATHDIASHVEGSGGAALKGFSVHKNTEAVSGIRIFAQGSDSINYIEANIYGVS